jgi:hypothetical protein
MSFSFYCKPVTVTVTVDTMEAFDMETVTVESDVETLEIDALLAEICRETAIERLAN